MYVSILDKHVGVNKITSLVRKLSFIFKNDDKLVPDVHFEFTCDKLDALSSVVIYKAFDYADKHNCLKRPSANLKPLLDLCAPYGIEKLMKRLISRKEVKSLYKNLKPIEKEDFFIAPHAINRESFKNKQELENKYTQFISNYYQDICPELVPYFKTCLCEIASNFYYHALEDENSILMAEGNKKQIEIVCVDNSRGILKSLDPENKNKHKVMRNAFQRGVSSKKDANHCGTGLWFVDKISEYLDGTLRVISDDLLYLSTNKGNLVVRSPIWRGCIFYLKLKVVDHTEIDNFFRNLNKDNKLDLVNVN